MKPDICIYHGNCADGFGAAWVVRRAFGDGVRFIPGVYGHEPPDVDGQNVLMVDFTFKRPVLEGLLRSGDAKQAMTICILDHHKTAAADLDGISKPEGHAQEGAYDPWYWRRKWEDGSIWPVRALFDMERSGAQITWDFLFPGQPRPKLIDYIGDRDLWRFNLPNSREVAAWLFSHPYDFALWDELSEMLAHDPVTVMAEGAAIERKHRKDIDELLSQTMRYMVIGGIRVPVANIPYTMASDAAGQLAEGNAFAACYFDRPDARVFSLRSRGPDAADVSEIARAYGGGGHKNAAGFQATVGWEGDGA
jgi:oligoribonuclease NrnB/cAMP/cGMP phosphodiesterase (DHH superfamily)